MPADADPRRVSALDLVGARVGKDLPAVALDGLRQAAQILERMKLALVGESQRGAAFESGKGDAVHHLDVRQAGATGGRELALEIRTGLSGRGEEESIDSEEVTLDAL